MERDLPEFDVTPGMMVVFRVNGEDTLGTVTEAEDEWVEVRDGPRIHIGSIKAVALYRDQADFQFGGEDGAQ